MTQPNDYLGVLTVEPEDAEQAGVKGMRWGVRNDRSTLKAAAAARKETPKADSKPAPKGNIQDNVESSASRYSRLASDAKAGKAADMTEQDLKFFNARTDALAKVAKITEEKPSWLQETATNVLQTTAKNQMQGIADTLADKYVGAPIKDAIKGAAK